MSIARRGKKFTEKHKAALSHAGLSANAHNRIVFRRKKPNTDLSKIGEISPGRDINLDLYVELRRSEFDKILSEQNNVCAICGNLPNKGRLAVDHCYKTGKIRALLCRICNSGIGFFRDDQELLVKAIAYLKKHEILAVS